MKVLQIDSVCGRESSTCAVSVELATCIPFELMIQRGYSKYIMRMRAA